MTNGTEDQSGDGSGRSNHTVQPLCDLELNWAVDLAKNLEKYLLKICSGEISGDNDSHLSVNFAEAALLLQGSIQVYSRKVEYLYNLVLHALEFISQNRQQDQPDSTAIQPEEGCSHAVPDEENDLFWGLDDIPVEAKNSLDSATSKDAHLNHFVKPPANLVVLEGDCLDTSGDGGELELYLLASNDLYRDFILLDPCDAVAVDDFLKGGTSGKEHNGAYRGSSLNSKTRKSFQSPTIRSGGTAHKSSHGKSQDVNLNRSPWDNCNVENVYNLGPDPPACDIPANSDHGFDMIDELLEPRDLDDSDYDDNDPWKPLNPHEPGNLKVKPFKKVKAHRRQGVNSTKRIPITEQFPPAKMHGTISPELTEMWETQRRACERQQESPPFYEKLRQSLIHGGHENCDTFCNPEVDEDNGYDSDIPDFKKPDVDTQHNMCMDEDVPLHNEKHDDGAVHFDTNEAYDYEDPHSHASLEDLCRSHLDALLASIAETEKQTELAARVSTWKQKIEHNLEEQDLRPPFDIHDYGKRILDKLSHKSESANVLSYTDVVEAHEKHDVARTFSALLQLVNNGDVDLDRGRADGESVCYTAANPFYVRLLSHDKKQVEARLQSSKKRAKSPTRRGCSKGEKENSAREKPPAVHSLSSGPTSAVLSTQPNGKFYVKVGKIAGIRCTPEGKRRRRSRFVETADLHSAG